jgi:orotidine-5'-phosphate decarboxylase
MAAKDRIIFALDVGDLASAKGWAKTLGGSVGWFKVGLELFTAAGPEVVELITGSGIRCFLDLKFHDIPNTVAGAVRSATRLKAEMMTIHISGGREMIQAAVKAADDESACLGIARPKLIGVSVLTSLCQDDLPGLGVDKPLKDHVSGLVSLACGQGIGGIVCSPADLPFVRPMVPQGTVIITPGIRPQWSETGDQKRFATPASAISAGADLMVIGRPISHAPDPLDAVKKIVDEIETARV